MRLEGVIGHDGLLRRDGLIGASGLQRPDSIMAPVGLVTSTAPIALLVQWFY